MISCHESEDSRQEVAGIITNDNFEPENYNEALSKTINDIYYRSYGSGIDTLKAEDIALLQSIIHICPLAGGPAVYRARAMYNLFNDSIYYNDKLVCSNEGYFRESQEQLMPELTKLETKNINFNIFPNPSKNKITVLTEGFQGDAQIKVYNLMGQVIDSFSIQQGNNTKEVDISTWAEGYYSIHCTSVDFAAVKPLIKIK